MQSARAQDSFKDCDTCPEMVVIPAGEVMLGSHEFEAFRRPSERPKQRVKIKQPFAMAKTETTRAHYR
ncbi:MAG: SUMF1/EgtB/PvdO family nonheme iron enzyme, partial [Pseudomonadota bacterium]